MKNFTQTMTQHEINSATRWTASMRDYMRAGDYHMAHFCAMELAKDLAAAERYLYADGDEIDETTAAQIYTAAIAAAQRNTENEYNPESAQTVADLRAELKSGSDNAAQLVNDLISDNPNQATAWVTRDDIDRHADDMTDEQRAALMDYMRTEYELIDTSAEITNAREMMDELDK